MWITKVIIRQLSKVLINTDSAKWPSSFLLLPFSLKKQNNQSDDQTTLQYVILVWLYNQRHELPRSISALFQNIPWDYCAQTLGGRIKGTEDSIKVSYSNRMHNKLLVVEFRWQDSQFTARIVCVFFYLNKRKVSAPWRTPHITHPYSLNFRNDFILLSTIMTTACRWYFWEGCQECELWLGK